MIVDEATLAPSGLTYEEAIARARALAPAIERRAPAAEAQRRQPMETIQEFAGAGLVRMLVPRRWGGHELSLDALIHSAGEIAKADASAGWCYAFLVIHGCFLAHFPEQAQREGIVEQGAAPTGPATQDSTAPTSAAAPKVRHRCPRLTTATSRRSAALH